MSLPRTPPGLAAGGRRLWKAVVAEYDLAGHECEVLRLACIALDRADAAAKSIATDGAIVEDRFGQSRAHPAITIERDSRLALMRGLRELALEVDVGPDRDVRPPRLVRRGA